MLNDDRVDDYVDRVGARLVENIPAEFRHNEFRYTFDVVNLREINAFALPGGPMYAHRGMIEKARTEGEMAGVLAHEISHVALRHGTAQASAAGKYQMGQMGSAILGAIIGGRTGAVVSQVGQFGFGAAFCAIHAITNSRPTSSARRSWRGAGYDPREMASMFRTIEKEGGGRAPEWMSNHPNPGNRAEYITREAQALRVDEPGARHRGLQCRAGAAGQMSPAPTTEEVARGTGRRQPRAVRRRTNAPPTARVAAPSTRYTTYNEGDVFRIGVPSNWREMASESSRDLRAGGGLRRAERAERLHARRPGGDRAQRNHRLEEATQELIASLAQANPQLARGGTPTRGTLGGRPALRTLLANVSDATGGRERIMLYTAQMQDGPCSTWSACRPKRSSAPTSRWSTAWRSRSGSCAENG